MFIFILGFFIIWGCGKIGKIAGSTLFPDKNSSGYIDKSTTIIHHHHHHYHDNRSVHVDGEKLKDLI